jgi:glycosyltransferase involved in cell wall biosynthesis
MKILMIVSDSMLPRRRALVDALEHLGHTVILMQPTLRGLPGRWFFAFVIAVNALIVYKTRFRKYLNKTSSAFYIYGFAIDALIKRHKDADALILIGANSRTVFWRKNPKLSYFVMTDHVNLLSKELKDYGVKIPERRVYARWNDLERLLLLEQDHIFVLGSHVKRAMVDLYGIDSQKITVTGAGPNVDIDIVRDNIKKDYHSRNILFVGLDAERKGLDLLVRAFRRVKSAYPDAILHVVGKAGTTAGGVVYHGKLSGIPLKRLYYECQVFAMPSYREPFGVVYVEAMMAKAVCIGTNVGAAPEIFVDAHSGLIIEPGDDSALTERILQLFSNHKHMKTLAENGYERAKCRWTWAIAAQRISEKLY